MQRLTNLIFVIALVLAACAPTPPATPAGTRPARVVATFSLIGDWARIVGGEHIALTVLAGPGVDTHTFSPTPADGKALANAEVIFENGIAFETWLDDLYAASESRAQRVSVTAGLSLHKAGDHTDDDHADDNHAEASDHAHGDSDPHVWHDVANAIAIVENIRAALAQADPANAAAYAANAAAYTTELQTLDAWVLAQVATLPTERRQLVTPHDTFGYFAERYGFTVVGTVLPASTEGASPSAEELAQLIDAVKAAGVPAVFAETVSGESLIQQVAAEAGVSIVPLYTDALGPAGSSGDTYLRLMRANVTAIVEALR
jgi:ABC-type Zn uptake system ZnuABC Zn-binding protein ZnuA